ncbi:MAG: pyrroline-5-carboxylate reductase [Pseudomonadota bacterium]
MSYSLILIGCGKMGGALAHNWLENGLIGKIQILDPYEIDQKLSTLPTVFHVKHSKDVDVSNVDLVIFAVKPQTLDELCQDLKNIIPQNTPILSIAAGKDTQFFKNHFPRNEIIRSIPNTPAMIGKGMSVLYADDKITEKSKNMASELMKAAGEYDWIENEGLMDLVTAVSGSGPAYLFYLIEALEKSALKQGLNTNLAQKMARQTVIGAAALAEHEPEISAKELRQNVTSPGGTTEAGLEILMNREFDNIIDAVIEAAKNRGKALNS